MQFGNISQRLLSAIGLGATSSRPMSGNDQPYRLGQISKRGSNPAPYSGDAALSMSSDLMHRRSREMYNNKPLAKRPIDLIRDLVVGTGINAFSNPIDHTFGWDLNRRPLSDLHHSFDYSLESDEVFERWANDPMQCDVEQTLTWFDMQRLALSETATVGDTIIKFVFTKPQPGMIPFKLQLLEREMLDDTKDRPATATQNRIVNGIEIDHDGFEIGIYVYDEHPHDTNNSVGGSFKSTFVPANMYCHFYQKTRPSQHLGATWIHATGQTIIDRDQFADTTLRKLIKQAMFVLAYKTDTPGSMMSLDPDDGGSLVDVRLGHDPIAAEIGSNEEIELLDSSSPGDNVVSFFDQVDHDIASATNLSPYSVTGRFEKTNYGGFRGAMNLEDAQTQPIKNTLGARVVLPVRRMFNMIAIASGEITSVQPRQFVKEKNRFQKFDCIGAGRALLDDEKETEAAISKLRSGLSTLKIECARRGLHWLHILRQTKLQNAISAALGVTLDFSKGNGGQREDENSRSDEGSDKKTGKAMFG